ncbi:protein kinase [Myxococcota bacterium]|nr:protein kinase [Myxococcota bacterium]
MAQPSPSIAPLVEDAQLILRTVRAESLDGRRPYASDVSRWVERSLRLRFGEMVQCLERYGFVSLERRTQVLELTPAGRQCVDGVAERIRALEGDLQHHFGDRLAQLAAPLPEVEHPPIRFDGRYMRSEPIGLGAVGSVWRGRLLSVDRPVAIKVFSGLDELFSVDQKGEILRRLEHAVREHARLVSPFAIQILDQNVSYESPYFVMELATGGNLRALLEGGALPAPVAMRYFVQMALGLRAAHAQGLLHRDLKPENVLLDANGNVKLADFGLTRALERDGVKVRQAYVGFGSVGYMPPELFRRGAEIGPTADIYALGILLFEMLVGELPGRRSPMPSAVASGVPVELDELFDQMTQDDPARRPADLDKVLTSIWTSQSITALLDARQAPFFSDPPVALPGLSPVSLPPSGAGARAAARGLAAASPAAPTTVSRDAAPRPAPAPPVPTASTPREPALHASEPMPVPSAPVLPAPVPTMSTAREAAVHTPEPLSASAAQTEGPAVAEAPVADAPSPAPAPVLPASGADVPAAPLAPAVGTTRVAEPPTSPAPAKPQGVPTPPTPPATAEDRATVQETPAASGDVRETQTGASASPEPSPPAKPTRPTAPRSAPEAPAPRPALIAPAASAPPVVAAPAVVDDPSVGPALSAMFEPDDIDDSVADASEPSEVGDADVLDEEKVGSAPPTPDDSLVDEPDPGHFLGAGGGDEPGRGESFEAVLEEDDVVLDDEPESSDGEDGDSGGRFQTAVVDTRKPATAPRGEPKGLGERLRRLKDGG